MESVSILDVMSGGSHVLIVTVILIKMIRLRMRKWRNERSGMNIIEFVETQMFQKSKSFQLYPMQVIILKSIYGLDLTAQEIVTAGLSSFPVHSGAQGVECEQVVGALGRRTGKDVMLSIIAAYEIYRLMEMKNPHTRYHLMQGSHITVLGIAANVSQSTVLFREMLNTIGHTDYFNGRYKAPRRGHIIFETDSGPVDISITHSNENAIIGRSAKVLLVSELASFRNQDIIDTLRATLATFRDSKSVIFSTPSQANDTFYDLYNGQPRERFLSFALPTWEVNTRLSEGALRATTGQMSGAEFDRQFGASFGFIPEPMPIVVGNSDEPVEPVEKVVVHKFTQSYPTNKRLDLDMDE